jgi:NitT/TauT family transport system substrate-binding protein
MKFGWILLLLIVNVTILASCGTEAAQAPPKEVLTAESAPTQTAEVSTEAATQLKQVRLGVGYIPDVQFAPFYVAQSKGYYANEGLEVSIEYGFENDFVALAAQGEREFAIASGDQVILARAQGLPITYVMKWYQRYPVALVSQASQNIRQPADLAGKKVGLPGLFGASFIGWKALAYATQLDESTVKVEEIGFTQAAAVQQGLVDAAMVYIANEPNQLRAQGIEVNVIEVSDYINLVSNGLVVGEKLVGNDPDMVQRMVRASLRGLKDTNENSDEAFKIVRQVIPEMTDEKATTQRKVLEDSIKLWQNDQLGLSSEAAWRESVEFMAKTGLLQKEVSVETLFTNKFVAAE